MNLYVDDIADGAVVDEFLYLLEIGQIATVVSYEAGDPRLFADAVDTGTIGIAGSHGLLNVSGFACAHGHNGKCGMRRGWGGYVHGIDLRVVNQLLRIGVPLAYAVALGIRLGLFRIAAHNGYYA